jgi:predicted DNA-binding transcriptional regulator AlpA
MVEKKIMDINEMVIFTGMSRRTIYYKMNADTLPFKWFEMNGHRVAYFDDVSDWFYKQIENNSHYFTGKYIMGEKKFYDAEQRRHIFEIYKKRLII